MSVRDTSLAAWMDLQGRGVLQDQERAILQWAHMQTRPFIRKEIAAGLNMQTGTVSARVTRLVKLGFLKELFSRHDGGYELQIPPRQLSLEIAA